MDIVDREIGIGRPEHSPERAAPVQIGHFMPIPRDAAPGTGLGEHSDDPRMPVEDRAPSVEGQHLDSIHRVHSRLSRSRCR